MKNLLKTIGIICVNAVFTLILVEIGLRLAGWGFLVLQHQQNARRFSDKENIVIMCVGESTTALGGDDSYPTQLNAILAQRIPDRNIAVVNKGIPGQNSDYILAHLEQWLDEYRPDIVLVMMGINDQISTLVPFASDMDINLLQKAVRSSQTAKLFLWFKSALTSTPSDQAKKKAFPVDAVVNHEEQSMNQENAVLFLKALDFQKRGQTSEAEQIYRYLLMNRKLGGMKFDVEMKMIALLKKSNNYFALIKMLPYISHYQWKKEWFDQACISQSGAALVNEEILSVLETRPNKHVLYDHLSYCYKVLGDKQQSGKYQEDADTLRRNFYSPTTKKNYTALVRMLKERNIIGAYIQYPLRSIRPLRLLLADNFDVSNMILIENKAGFEEALMLYPYEEIFTDHFAGDFGHCTKLGNRIIAENIADRVEKVLSGIERAPAVKGF